MKSLKLVLVFIVILVGVIGVLYLINNPDDRHDTPLLDSDVNRKVKEIIDGNWDEVSDWDVEVFNRMELTIRQYAKQDGANESLLMDYNVKEAIRIVNEHIFNEWESTDCHETVIKKYIKAIETIVNKHSAEAENSQIITIKRVNAAYREAIKIAHHPCNYEPEFDGNDWQSYSNYQQHIERNKNDVLGNADYKQYLSNIADIKNGIADVPNRLQKGKERFYSRLSDEIIDYFGAIASNDRTRAQLTDLRNIRNRFEKEYQSADKLSVFSMKFKDDVERNEADSEKGAIR